MTAAYLGKALEGTVKITVLEAPSIPKIGVGEAAIPNLQRVFFDYLGIPEDEWMRECNASFKMAVKFINWRTPGGPQATSRQRPDGRPDHFHHPFGILPAHDSVPLSHLWAYQAMRGSAGRPYDYSCFAEPPLMDAKLAPRFRDGTPATAYAWHFDAHLVADYLCRHGIEPYTSAIAMPSGWTWKIPMLTRFGTGYVYSSKFASRDQATMDLCQLWGLDPAEEFNHVRFRVGRNRRSWVKNCVSIGLSSCFVEPLESSGLYFTYASIYLLAKYSPTRPSTRC